MTIRRRIEAVKNEISNNMKTLTSKDKAEEILNKLATDCVNINLPNYTKITENHLLFKEISSGEL